MENGDLTIKPTINQQLPISITKIKKIVGVFLGLLVLILLFLSMRLFDEYAQMQIYDFMIYIFPITMTLFLALIMYSPIINDAGRGVTSSIKKMVIFIFKLVLLIFTYRISLLLVAFIGIFSGVTTIRS